MPHAAQPILDPLAYLADTDTQRLAASMAQEAFSRAFQRSVRATDDRQAQAALKAHCHHWCQASAEATAQPVRLALLISGLDQWGLAYSQAFQLRALPALSELIGALRNGLEPRSEARFQRFFEQIEVEECAAIDFKIALRRHIHLALWHAMAACDSDTAATPISQALGSLLLALHARMPTLGWRLLADSLASIQLALLNAMPPSELAQRQTHALFAALRQALPAATYQRILAHSGQAVLAWQRARQAH